VDDIDEQLNDSFASIVNVFAFCVFLLIVVVLAVGLWSRSAMVGRGRVAVRGRDRQR
jgi:hypothetical protein